MECDYTDGEIRAELARLGYQCVTQDQLHIFKKNLMKLIREERKKNTLQKKVSDVLEASGKNRNHGNTTSQNNIKKEWASSDSGEMTSPYNWAMNDYGRKSSKENLNVEYNKHPDVMNMYGDYNKNPDVASMHGQENKLLDMASLQRKYSFLNIPNITFPSSETNMKSKTVKWKFSREGTFDSTAGDLARENVGSHYSSSRYDGAEVSPRTGRQNRRGDQGEIMRPASAMNQGQQGPKNVARTISAFPGIIAHREHPHTRNLYRTKPFERHQMYLRIWRTQPPVGEASRNNLIKKIHRRMLKKEEIKFPQKTLTPNPYVVPTTKPRYELRWAIRHCNENYEMPPCGFFHEA